MPNVKEILRPKLHLLKVCVLLYNHYKAKKKEQVYGSSLGEQNQSYQIHLIWNVYIMENVFFCALYSDLGMMQLVRTDDFTLFEVL